MCDSTRLHILTYVGNVIVLPFFLPLALQVPSMLGLGLGISILMAGQGDSFPS